MRIKALWRRLTSWTVRGLDNTELWSRMKHCFKRWILLSLRGLSLSLF